MSSASAHRIRLLPAIDAAKASGAGDGAFFCLAATAAKTARCNENNGLAFRHDWGYKDHGISGTRGRDKRPGFDKLCRDAARREFDVVMAWSVDRLGRSLQDLVGFLSELHALKIDLFLPTGAGHHDPRREGNVSDDGRA